ncbi:hypothetical protein HWC53_gp052 [Bacillus phage vB_BmeM-Goe8]|uniref:Uncharacterized protein n=1 Tax=Bacillus phage vB_BmeM-Goe8 TaxID=2593638 RepID=A0A516KMN8_9CAUD|nr:hypothetical protein HWC53_gp052 [Bacillus phage vB_BmeM-Goe8]QDP42836.1 hypothetical protein Goe8_c00520 [Bacillus phage vB_BmeM-Goe8]
MSIKENKYHNTVKLEFRDLVASFTQRDRSQYHMFTIHRLLSLGLLIDFTYRYCTNSTPDKYIRIELDLKEHGRVLFKINTESNYGSVADDISMKVLENFLVNFDTGLDDKGKRGSFGL